MKIAINWESYAVRILLYALILLLLAASKVDLVRFTYQGF